MWDSLRTSQLLSTHHGTLIEFSPIDIGTTICFALSSVHWILYYAEFVLVRTFFFWSTRVLPKIRNRQVDQKKKSSPKQKSTQHRIQWTDHNAKKMAVPMLMGENSIRVPWRYENESKAAARFVNCPIYSRLGELHCGVPASGMVKQRVWRFVDPQVRRVRRQMLNC